MTYEDFLKSKIPSAEVRGFEPPSKPHPILKPHQADVAAWMVRGGQRACFMAFGLGKTLTHLQVAKWVVEYETEPIGIENPVETDPVTYTDPYPQQRIDYVKKKYLIVAPLGVRREFMTEQGPMIGLTDIEYCRNNIDVRESKARIVITNYERVRDGDITIDERFCGAGLDESSVLRSYGSKTYQTFLKLFKKVKYRFVFTATPSPNKHKELIHYGGFLGVMDTGECLTRFFKRNSTQANDLTLYPQSEEQFWLWLSSWAVFMQKPSDLGYSDEGYDLPPMKVHWHCVPVDHKKAWEIYDGWGQAQLFLDKTSGLRDNAKVKRETMITRIAAAKEIVEAHAGEHFIVWHELEDERRLLEKAFPEMKTAYGNQPLPDREEIILGFGDGQFPLLGTKASIAGSGTNMQRFCHNAIFLGSTYKFNDLIQSIHRLHRFLQKYPVNIWIIYTESEDPVVATLKKKWAQHNALVEKMSGLLRRWKFSIKPDMNLKKSFATDRLEVTSKNFRCINNDCVLELMPIDFGHEWQPWEDGCVDLIVSSIPFGNQYEYTTKVNDMGSNPDNEAFFQQLDFLIPNLLRVLKPGRIAAIHVKDRIRFGGVTGQGAPSVDRFSDKTADCFQKHGFYFQGRITIDTDVVRENNQTYRLGWSECCKDGTKMGVGMPEYVLLFRKPQTNTEKGFADVPVTKDKAAYTRAQWQVDAAALWRSSGNRLPDPELLLNMPMDSIGRLWKAHCNKLGYDYNEHIEVGKELEKLGKLPASFMLFPPVSRNHDIWTDILRMRILGSEKKAKQDDRKEKNHICPLQLDIVERLINRFSNPGEIVMDPFGGIGTVAYQAIHQGRIGWSIELSLDYWKQSVNYCEQAELQRNAPTLFDLCDYTKEAEVPVDFIETVEPPPMPIEVKQTKTKKKKALKSA